MRVWDVFFPLGAARAPARPKCSAFRSTFPPRLSGPWARPSLGVTRPSISQEVDVPVAALPDAPAWSWRRGLRRSILLRRRRRSVRRRWRGGPSRPEFRIPPVAHPSLLAAAAGLAVAPRSPRRAPASPISPKEGRVSAAAGTASTGDEHALVLVRPRSTLSSRDGRRRRWRSSRRHPPGVVDILSCSGGLAALALARHSRRALSELEPVPRLVEARNTARPCGGPTRAMSSRRVARNDPAF